MRSMKLCLFLLLTAACHDDPAVIASFNQTTEGGQPVVPEFGSQYQTGGLEYKALCIYEDDSYAHVTHYWSANTVMQRPDAVERGTLMWKGTDSLYFSGTYLNMRGRLDGDVLNVNNGTHIFVRSEIACPPAG